LVQKVLSHPKLEEAIEFNGINLIDGFYWFLNFSHKIISIFFAFIYIFYFLYIFILNFKIPIL
jgi:hypothetical protein